MFAIDVKNFSKIYKSKFWKPNLAVNSINFQVACGEAFGFVGQNGAGKSTTIKALVGTIRPSGGTIELFGRSVLLPESRVGLGYAPESPYLHDYLSPLEILQMGLKLHKVDVKNEVSHCMEWLERFGLADVANKRIRSFSKGMTQRTALAHALCIQPRLLVLDEPLSGLDPVGRRQVVDILHEYKSEGGSLLFSSHVLHDVERLADRFGLIHRGELRAIRSQEDLHNSVGYLTVHTRGTSPVSGMNLLGDGRYTGEVPRAKLWQQLELLRSAGHEVLEIKAGADLERVFLELIADRE